MAGNLVYIDPQPGPQQQFLSSSADIVIFGGAAGGGKTYSLLLDPIRYIHIPGFSGAIFRRETPEIKNPGALWDESMKLYSAIIGSNAVSHVLEWNFSSGAKIKFSHMEHEKDKFGWQGSQIAYLGFDEVTHFSKSQFFYMMSRNRTTCGIKPYIRATCNPDPDSWVKDMILWWLDENGEFPDPEKAGKIRWFVNDSDNIVWADTKEELTLKYPKLIPTSFSFIPSKLTDNKKLMEADPNYLGKLLAMPMVERERLLNGNWKIRHTAGQVFRVDKLEIIDAAPAGLRMCRGWDRAATPGGGDYTAHVKIGRDAEGRFYILDAGKRQVSALDADQMLISLASQDGTQTIIRLPQDPGQAGKAQAEYLVRQLSGYIVKAIPPTGSKITRANPLAAQIEAGNVKLIRGDWNRMFIDELASFPEGKHDDLVDAASDAFNELSNANKIQMFLG